MAECNDQIYRTPEKPLQGLEQAEVGVGIGPCRQRLEVDQEIKVAFLRVEIFAQRRAEQRQPLYVVATAEIGHLLPLLVNVRSHASSPAQSRIPAVLK